METGANLPILQAEGVWLHYSLFHSPIPEPVLQKYIEAHTYYLTSAEEPQLRWLAESVRLRFDLEALELVLRFSDEGHLLVRKAKILVYITEAFDAYRSHFVNDHPHRIKAWTVLSFHGLRTAWKFFKGQFLLWRLKRRV